MYNVMTRCDLPTFSDASRHRGHAAGSSYTVVRLPAAVVAQQLRRASSVRLSPFRNRFVAAVDLSSSSRVLN